MFNNKTIFNSLPNVLPLNNFNVLSSSAPIDIQTPQKKKGCMVKDTYNGNNSEEIEEEVVEDIYADPDKNRCKILYCRISKEINRFKKNTRLTNLNKISEDFRMFRKYKCLPLISISEGQKQCSDSFGRLQTKWNSAQGYEDTHYGRTTERKKYWLFIHYWELLEGMGCMLADII